MCRLSPDSNQNPTPQVGGAVAPHETSSLIHHWSQLEQQDSLKHTNTSDQMVYLEDVGKNYKRLFRC